MNLRELNLNVIQAAERRIVEIFAKNKYVGLSFSGGKDSICLADMAVRTMQKYNIDFSRLLVIFFDEEAIYPDIERITMSWRRKLLDLGASFNWYCLPIKHFNCCNQLANDESFICWEPGKEDTWVRQPPKFAIRFHDKLKYGMTYQKFSDVLFKNIPMMIGVRAYESVQRITNFSMRKINDYKTFPIYDWTDADVWLYIKKYGLEFPETYIYLYKVGVSKRRLRISQFFSIDTIKSLPRIMEFYPDLYERIIRREPNADLAMLYWDTDMFRSNRQNTEFKKDTNYRELLSETMKKAVLHPSDYPGFKQAKMLYSKTTSEHSENVFKLIYQILIAGDPKMRTYRKCCGAIRQYQ